MSRNQRHVIPSPRGGWDVKKPNASRASSNKPTQKEDIARAREILSNDGGGELVIHRSDGTIRDSDTVPPSNDPFPPRDQR